MTDLTSLAAIRAILAAAPDASGAARSAAADRNLQLTKPPGALGRLEDLAAWYAGWRNDPRPRITAPQVLIFAGNHGVAAQGVSAFPVAVTAQMVENFRAGGAAINQLAELAGARLDVHALDLDRPTADFTQGAAMTEAEVCAAFATGWTAVDPKTDLLVTGEMGIGNTTSAAAIAGALLGGEGWAGRGTGVDDAGLARKAAAIAQGLAANPDRSGLGVLMALGGREVAAVAGAIAGARARRIPVILDGFICTAAALCLHVEDARALDHCVAGHLSAEGAHDRMLAALGMQPLLSLGLRLGEGSGAALAIQVLRGALACHSGMATFAEAGVSGA
ncbi:nicotinate-nucleotide--dimethylbenzimidazole phosphoribosyltransferase [Jannaschia rubra]|uniref:Nicotinate-nucleotide--dimethylbenzimidazole phosphoribosyltransferase n=1 Tax=Jannaschia rubra TaxID=282197 RepID=A0A0M6XRU8_9RHOB|nr:nicotinate-nucleotide--dimethylbenzimidazole phosphoribosyltransferase [Jannaschia rubra]CTQ33800.1 Nicotinate-nucleotide--dimethylbenzimidazole phosphoribosyltransferase [Jannaschia rubra]SFG09387.1 nicotinate-nucleotide-dimethylbenzimidazole phosphoribosyltransferase [Jannaschia rubra]